LATKKAVTVKITSESQLRKLPAPIAQRIAQRLNGTGAPAQNEQPAAEASGAPIAKAPAPGTSEAAAGSASATGASGEGRGNREFGARGGRGQSGAGGAMDLQQMISRMPSSTISDLQKGDAVMLVGTEGGANAVTVITLLAGVEPILQGSPNSASSILSPWSLSGAPSGEAGTP
jgi:hypothetical protein